MLKRLPSQTGQVSCASCRDIGSILDISTSPPTHVACPDCCPDGTPEEPGAPAPNKPGAPAPKSEVDGAFDKAQGFLDGFFDFAESLFGKSDSNGE